VIAWNQHKTVRPGEMITMNGRAIPTHLAWATSLPSAEEQTRTGISSSANGE
jgi:hypothetical protein